MNFLNLSNSLKLASAAFTILAVTAACSSAPSRKDCEQTDYYQMGLSDGKDGKDTERFQKLKDSCGSEGIAVTQDLQSKYAYGRQVGMAQYCDGGRGASDAKSGKSDSICMKEKIPPYETAYRKELMSVQEKQAQQQKDIEESRIKLQSQQEKLRTERERLKRQQSGISGQ